MRNRGRPIVGVVRVAVVMVMAAMSVRMNVRLRYRNATLRRVTVKMRSAGQHALQQIDGGHQPNQRFASKCNHMHIMCINVVVVKVFAGNSQFSRNPEGMRVSRRAPLRVAVKPAPSYSRIPAIHAVMKQASVPPSMALSPSRAMSPRRSGAMPPMPPI